MSDFNFESFINRLRRKCSNFLDEEFIMELENNWYEGRYKTQTLASSICKKIPDDRLTDWIRNGVESIQRAPFVPRSRPKYCESKGESPSVKPTCGYSKEAYSVTAISEPDAITFRYHVKVLERGIGNCSERDITIVLSGCHNRNFLEEGLYKIAWRAKDLVKKMKTRDTIIWVCLKWYMDTLEGILERDIYLDEDIPLLPHEEILGEDELEMFKSTYRMLVKLRKRLGLVQVNFHRRKYHYTSDNSTIDGNLNYKERFLQISKDKNDPYELLKTTQREKTAAVENNRDNERILVQYQQELNRTILKMSKAEDDNIQLQNRVDDEHRQVLEYDQQLKVLKREKQDLETSNNEFEKKLIEIKQELDQTKSELRKAKDEVNSLQNENDWEKESVRKHDHQLHLLNQEKQNLEDRNKKHEKKMRDKQNELKKTQENLIKAEEENSRLQKDNRAHAKIVEQELNSLKVELRSVKEKNDTLRERNKEYENNLREKQYEVKKTQSDLCTREEENSRLRKKYSKLGQEADQYMQERNSVEEELRKTEETMSSAQERIDHLERELKHEQRQLTNVKSQLQQTLNNDDLRIRLTKAQEESNQLKETLSRFQKETGTEDESILKLRQEAERYKQERDSVKEEMQKANEKTFSSQKGNSKFRQEADQYKQERDRVTEELRKTTETLSSAQERIERLERNVEDEQRQSANAKSELQHTIGINEDLQTKLTNAQKKISQLKDTLSRFQKDTRLEDESILKLRQEAERYKQERDIVKEELQKAYEETISSQKGIVHLQKNLKEQNLPLDSVKLELRQTREENKDLQKRLENSQKETNELKESFSRVRKETRTEDERSTLRGEAEPYKQERDYLKEELQKAQEKTNSSRERIAQLEQKLEEQHRQMANVKSELRQTQERNEDLQNRFSQDTAAQLTQENPSIAELSDVNRPTKLAKRFFELYDNEWTDAFTAIEDDPRNVASEEDIAKKLKDILRNCFEECVDISNQQLADIEATLLNPGSGKHTSASRQLTTQQAMTITDLRRETSILSTEHVKQEMCRRFHDSTKLKDLKLFIEKCSELCWLMAVQSPPVVIEDRHLPGDRFNGDVFKAYTKSGKVIEYVVWPPVYLHKGGPLLCKGIAQGKE